MLGRRHHRLFEQANRVRLRLFMKMRFAKLIDGREASAERRSIKRLLDQETGSGRWLKHSSRAWVNAVVSG